MGELIKHQLNQALSANFYFWRDHVGNEIDVLFDDSLRLVPIEIKSGQTIAHSFYKGLHYWEKLTGESTGYIVYGGEQSRKGSNHKHVVSWRNIH